ncbi:cupredoxin domain-containing protein [Sneathiella limimaris]|uniref:cupredoxin domain-containing protein n=1 Tax=Sneathiella limimaris TaxID=1964213 RepID=UPI00146B48F3|nr:cupredoxin domain-containing protein [Sneathiella limimaris]
MKIRKNLLAAVPSVALFALAGFGQSLALAAGSHGGDDHHGKKAMAIGEPGEAANVSRTIEITLGDNFFEPEALSLKKGETVRFVIRNKGDFVHEFNIGTAIMHSAHQEEMAMMMEHGAIEPDRINHDKMKMDMGGGHMMSHDDPNSVLLEPGKEAEIIWNFSSDAALEFACNLPGHYQSGMVGNFQFN